MAYYDSLSSLGEHILNLNDVVKLKDISYQVTSSHLSNQDITGYNDQIFTKLGIKNPHTFCSNHYGYNVSRGAWPEFNTCDFPAATRLVKALFKIIENKETIASEESKENKEVAIDKLLKEESKLSVLLPSKHRNIKQVEAQKEITLNKL